MSAFWSQMLSIGGSVLTTLLAAWAKNYFERKRPAVKRDAADD